MIIKKINEVKFPESSPKKLLLFFAGWGIDEKLFAEYHPDAYDFMVIYDYSELQLDETLLTAYDEIKVIAWSMGIWAASQFLQNKSYPITEGIAINGTHFPVHDEKGIPNNIFKGTLYALNEKTLYKFQRRMCGSTDVLSRFLDKAPERKIEDLRKELEAIERMSIISPLSPFKWSKVYIGSRDQIFPVGNQQKTWEHTGYTLIDEPHYPEKLFEVLLK